MSHETVLSVMQFDIGVKSFKQRNVLLALSRSIEVIKTKKVLFPW